ncbi:MAG: hypothetical protein OSB62_03940 [Alphaproteobacteria bacterium]|nr:hypothetical protein [Alphaproteobacteria bacterium]
MTTTETNTPDVSIRLPRKALAQNALAVEGQMEKFVRKSVTEAGADEVRLPSDIGQWMDVPTTIDYEVDGETVSAVVVTDGEPLERAVSVERTNREVVAARQAEAKAKSEEQSKPKPQPARKPKAQGPKKYWATNEDQFNCKGVIWGDFPAKRAEQAAVIAKAAIAEGAKIIVMPKNMNDVAEAAMAEAGVKSAGVGGDLVWECHRNWEAQNPFQKKGGKRGGENRPQRKPSGYVQPGTGRSANRFAGMTPAQAKEALAKGKV